MRGLIRDVSYCACPSKCVSVELHLRDERTNEWTDGRTKRRVSLSVVSLMSVHPMGERTAMLHNNLRVDKNPGSTNKYTKFGQVLIRKIVKIIFTRCHTLRLECTKFYSRRLSVCPSVCPFVRLLDGVLHLWVTSITDIIANFLRQFTPAIILWNLLLATLLMEIHVKCILYSNFCPFQLFVIRILLFTLISRRSQLQ